MEVDTLNEHNSISYDDIENIILQCHCHACMDQTVVVFQEFSSFSHTTWPYTLDKPACQKVYEPSWRTNPNYEEVFNWHIS